MTQSPSAGPIFIIGTERSGSNLLRLILNAHSRITIPHPPHLMRFLAPLAERYGDLVDENNRRRLVDDALGLLRRHINPWPHPVNADRVLARATPTIFGVVAAIYEQHREGQGKARWGCKSTFMVDHVGQALAEYPEAAFIWLVREPCDVVSSAKRSVFGYSHPYRMAQLWRDQQERARAALETWGPERVYLLRYEELVSKPEQAVAQLCDFLGEQFEPAMLEHHTSAAARQTAALSESWHRAGEPVTAARIGAHQHGLTPRERLLVDRVTGPLKETLGYTVSPKAAQEPEPSALSVACWSALLRLRVEVRSMREDRNYLMRVRRDAYVRWLRLKALRRRSHAVPGSTGLLAVRREKS